MNSASILLNFIAIIETKYERKNLCLFANVDQLHISKMTITLSVLFCSAKLIGLVQILNATDKGQSEVIFDIIIMNLITVPFKASEVFPCLWLIQLFKDVENIQERVSEITRYYKGSRTWQRIKTNTIYQEVTKSIGEYFQKIVAGGREKENKTLFIF